MIPVGNRSIQGMQVLQWMTTYLKSIRISVQDVEGEYSAVSKFNSVFYTEPLGYLTDQLGLVHGVPIIDGVDTDTGSSSNG